MTSLELSELVKKEHRTILQLVKGYKTFLESLGDLNYKVEKTRGRPRRIFEFNEKQLSLLVTQMAKRTDTLGVLKQENLNVVVLRNELELKKLIEGIIEGFNETSKCGFYLIHQFGVDRYSVDFAIMQKYWDNYDDEIIALVELNETKSHKHTKSKDEFRKHRITEHLKSRYPEKNSFTFLDIEENNICEGIKQIIKILNSNFLNC